MATEIAGLPFWELTFDADGDPDGAQRDAFLAGVRSRGITDVIVFSHGWNNDRRIAGELYQRFFGLLGPQLPAAARATVGLAGVVWPSLRWSDEPIPDFFVDGSGMVGGGAPGPASVTARDTVTLTDPTLDEQTLAGLRAAFPAAAAPLEEMAGLLAGASSDAALTAFHRCLGEFSR
ncbi:MAG: hypothetical protein QOK35_3045, partial [Pseudonocardiales bacterium]|nr:hypothetical protein [Pseudonocardiales bacterium]